MEPAAVENDVVVPLIGINEVIMGNDIARNTAVRGGRISELNPDEADISRLLIVCAIGIEQYVLPVWPSKGVWHSQNRHFRQPVSWCRGNPAHGSGGSERALTGRNNWSLQPHACRNKLTVGSGRAHDDPMQTSGPRHYKLCTVACVSESERRAALSNGLIAHLEGIGGDVTGVIDPALNDWTRAIAVTGTQIA